MNLIKGKKNRIKIGDKVQLKPNYVNYIAGHISSLYKVGDEIPEGYVREIYHWLRAYTLKAMPYGVVRGYGAKEDDDTNKTSDRKFVCVEFSFNGEKKVFRASTYVSEKDLTAVRTKVRK